MFSSSLKGFCKTPRHSDRVLFRGKKKKRRTTEEKRNSLFNSSGSCSLNQPVEIKEKTLIIEFLSYEQTVETYLGKLMLTIQSPIWWVWSFLSRVEDKRREYSTLYLVFAYSCTFWFSIFNGMSMPEVKDTSESSPFGKLFQLFNLVSKKLNFFSQIFISLLHCLKQWIKDEQRMN